MAGVLCPQQAEGLRAETPLFALNLGVASEVLCACALRFVSQPLVQHLQSHPGFVSAKDNAKVRGPTCHSHSHSLLLDFGFS